MMAEAHQAVVQDQAFERFVGLLEHMLRIKASDIYLVSGSPPVFRVDGVGHPARKALDDQEIEEMLRAVTTLEQHQQFSEDLELNFALSLKGQGRFRVNAFRQRGSAGLVVRLIPEAIKTVDELGLPPVLKTVCLSKRGLVLVVGATGSGKSTTLAAMIDHRNRSETGHIVTIEDPIEFVHPHRRCVITQREVGVDTLSFGAALKNALRQAPDVIFIGEIRDSETMEAAIAFSETGHLCLSTLHANNANQAIERIVSFFPANRSEEIRRQLSLNLRAIVSQRLIADLQQGRVAALEVLLDTPRVRKLIARGDVGALKDAMEQSRQEGCMTFDSAIFELVAASRVAVDVALGAADSANNLRLRIERLQATNGQVPSRSALRLVPVGGG